MCAGVYWGNFRNSRPISGFLWLRTRQRVLRYASTFWELKWIREDGVPSPAQEAGGTEGFGEEVYGAQESHAEVVPVPAGSPQLRDQDPTNGKCLRCNWHLQCRGYNRRTSSSVSKLQS
ncbi:hypothetical protein FKM82_021693 [Ascaphus truei]